MSVLPPPVEQRSDGAEEEPGDKVQRAEGMKNDDELEEIGHAQ
jgi:hypothetical protein